MGSVGLLLVVLFEHLLVVFADLRLVREVGAEFADENNAVQDGFLAERSWR